MLRCIASRIERHRLHRTVLGLAWPLFSVFNQLIGKLLVLLTAGRCWGRPWDTRAPPTSLLVSAKQSCMRTTTLPAPGEAQPGSGQAGEVDGRTAAAATPPGLSPT